MLIALFLSLYRCAGYCGRRGRKLSRRDISGPLNASAATPIHSSPWFEPDCSLFMDRIGRKINMMEQVLISPQKLFRRITPTSPSMPSVLFR